MLHYQCLYSCLPNAPAHHVVYELTLEPAIVVTVLKSVMLRLWYSTYICTCDAVALLEAVYTECVHCLDQQLQCVYMHADTVVQ
jgi:hypothetical protein